MQGVVVIINENWVEFFFECLLLIVFSGFCSSGFDLIWLFFLGLRNFRN